NARLNGATRGQILMAPGGQFGMSLDRPQGTPPYPTPDARTPLFHTEPPTSFGQGVSDVRIFSLRDVRQEFDRAQASVMFESHVPSRRQSGHPTGG
ncbi:hypothetical protein, partial [Azospirillum sp. ST 5-10]|uniref:hypothetical protein n=1 Tax=Azospirillum sp. ST 5-10 TaxID=3445776 RepID=UPI003F4A1686